MAKYTDKDKGRVYAELQVNGGNVRRTSNNLGIPRSTVIAWRNDWEKNGVPISVQEAVKPAVENFVSDATRVRDKLLVRLEELVDDGKITAREIVPALGMLTDKLRAYEGLDTKVVKHQLELPEPDQMRELFAGVFEGVVGAAQRRVAELDVVDIEPAHYKELEPGDGGTA